MFCTRYTCELRGEAVAFYGGAAPGMRTMLDALHPAREVLAAGGAAAGLAAVAKAAADGADATAKMTALAGRSNYVPAATLDGVPDPGAKAVAIVLQALAQ